jgi:hypothetical protein
MGFDWKRVGERVGLDLIKSRLELSSQITDLETSVSHLEQGCRGSAAVNKPVERYGMVFGAPDTVNQDIDPEILKSLNEQRARLETLRSQSAWLEGAYDEQDAITSELAGKKIEASAIIPVNIWDKLCEKYLWRFENISEDGSTGTYTESRRPALFAFFLLLSMMGPIYYLISWQLSLVYGSCVLAAVLINYSVNMDGDSGETFVVMGVLSLLCGLFSNIIVTMEMCTDYKALTRVGIAFGGVFAYFLVFTLVLVLIAQSRNIFNRFLSKPSYLRSIWPDKVDRETGKQVKVNFKVKTNPDQSDLFEKLHQAEIKPMIAVTEDAIEVNGPSDIASQEGLSPDPVIYSRHGNMVVIHSRSGEFADEESVMRIVSNQDAGKQVLA